MNKPENGARLSESNSIYKQPGYEATLDTKKYAGVRPTIHEN